MRQKVTANMELPIFEDEEPGTRSETIALVSYEPATQTEAVQTSMLPHQGASVDCQIDSRKGWNLGFDVLRFVASIEKYRNPPFVLSNRGETIMAREMDAPIARNHMYRIDTNEALRFAVYLPAKPSYLPIRDEVLNAFQTPAGIVSIPAVSAYLELYPNDTSALVECLGHIASGHTRLDGNGRFGLIDEPVWVFEMYAIDYGAPYGIRPDYERLANATVSHLITKRFAEGLGLEREVWSVNLGKSLVTRHIQVNEKMVA